MNSDDPTDEESLALVRDGAYGAVATLERWIASVAPAKRADYAARIAELRKFVEWADRRRTPLLRAAKLERAYVFGHMLYDDMQKSYEQSKAARKPRKPRQASAPPPTMRSKVWKWLKRGIRRTDLLVQKTGCSEVYARRIRHEYKKSKHEGV